MPTYLSYDDTNMWSARVEGNGVSKTELNILKKKLKTAHTRLEKLHVSKKQGFFDLPYETETISLIRKRVANLKRHGVRHLIVVGIGGSDLGARALWQALGEPGKGMWVSFLGNPDPEFLAPYVGKQDWWKHTAINVISKSGSTLETISIFLLLRASLIASVGEKRHAQHVIVTTEPTDNPLHAMAKTNGYTVLPHPENVGGRFSVLSVVGLFPAACGGIDIKKLLAGAKWMEKKRREEGSRHVSASFAAFHYLAMEKRGQNQHVLMPYAEWLTQSAQWYRQLWAESLGKDKQGPTPLAASGVVDQHSQIQLYVDGPKNKVVTFVVVDQFRKNIKVPTSKDLPKEMSYLTGADFGHIMLAEQQGTAHGLTKAKCPNGTIHLSSISPESLGAFFQFYMQATVFFGELLNIDVYNQPGVEEGKKETKRLLAS